MPPQTMTTGVQDVDPKDLHRVLRVGHRLLGFSDFSGPAAAGHSAGVACGWVEKPAQAPSSGLSPTSL